MKKAAAADYTQNLSETVQKESTRQFLDMLAGYGFETGNDWFQITEDGRRRFLATDFAKWQKALKDAAALTEDEFCDCGTHRYNFAIKLDRIVSAAEGDYDIYVLTSECYRPVRLPQFFRENTEIGEQWHIGSVIDYHWPNL